MKEGLRDTIDSPADRRARNHQGKEKGANASQGGLGVFSRVVRAVNRGIRQERADTKNGRCRPLIGEVPSVRCERHAKDRGHGQQSCLRGDEEMRQGDIGKMSLDHQHYADRARFNGFVPAEGQSELMFLSEETMQVHTGVYEDARRIQNGLIDPHPGEVTRRRATCFNLRRERLRHSSVPAGTTRNSTPLRIARGSLGSAIGAMWPSPYRGESVTHVEESARHRNRDGRITGKLRIPLLQLGIEGRFGKTGGSNGSAEPEYDAACVFGIRLRCTLDGAVTMLRRHSAELRAVPTRLC